MEREISGGFAAREVQGSTVKILRRRTFNSSKLKHHWQARLGGNCY